MKQFPEVIKVIAFVAFKGHFLDSSVLGPILVVL